MRNRRLYCHKLIKPGLAAAFAVALSVVAPAQDTSGNAGNSGPVRLVRFSWMGGSVEWRPDSNSSWSDAAPNLPIRQGAQVWVPGSGRAELMFDDGTVARLSPGSMLTLQTLSSDSNGEFTDLKLDSGDVTVRSPHGYSTYQVDTPNCAVDVNGPARFRVNSGNDVSLYQFTGQASVQNDSGTYTVNAGQYGEISGPSAQLALSAMPGPDAWDQFNSGRDAICFSPTPHVPSNIALVCGGLDSYGHWVDDPSNGWIWVPSQQASWTPYSHGHWVFVNPYGWTWVGSEAWGWAPYHYGTWVHGGYGWAWCPGPATQYWSPAVVSFTYSSGSVCWAPLCPQEVHYPSVLSVGFRSGNWSLFFSIGGAACYTPAPRGGYCVPRPWSNTYVNRTTTIVNVTNIYNRTTVVNNTFVPRNARFGGAVGTSLAGFQGHGGSFHALGASGVTAFQHGKMLASTSGRPVFGPPSARPTAQSMSVNRTFTNRGPAPRTFTRTSAAANWGAHGAQRSAGRFHPAPQGAGLRTNPSRGGRASGVGTRGGAPLTPGQNRGFGTGNRNVGGKPANQPGRGWGQGYTHPNGNRNPGQGSGNRNSNGNQPANQPGRGWGQGYTHPNGNRNPGQGSGNRNPNGNPPANQPGRGWGQNRGGQPQRSNPPQSQPQNQGGQPPRDNPNQGDQPQRGGWGQNRGQGNQGQGNPNRGNPNRGGNQNHGGNRNNNKKNNRNGGGN